MSNTSDTQALLVQIMSMLAILHTIKELTNQSTSHASSSNTITANILTAIVHISDQIANAHVRSNAQTATAPPSSEAQQLADMKAIFEQGLIPSREIYEDKVRQILGLR